MPDKTPAERAAERIEKLLKRCGSKSPCIQCVENAYRIITEEFERERKEHEAMERLRELTPSAERLREIAMKNKPPASYYEGEDEPMTIDWTKPIETVDGQKARYLAPLHGTFDHAIAVMLDGICERVVTVTNSGGTNGMQLIRNVPERFERTVWVNVYDADGHGHVASGYGSKDEADRGTYRECRVARIKVTLAGVVGQMDE